MGLAGDGKPGFHSKQCIIPKHALQRRLQPILVTEMIVLPTMSIKDNLCLMCHAQVLASFLKVCLASNRGDAVPANSYSLLWGRRQKTVAASADIAGLLCHPAHVQTLSFSLQLGMWQWMVGEMVLSLTFKYFQNSSVRSYGFWLLAL